MYSKKYEIIQNLSPVHEVSGEGKESSAQSPPKRSVKKSVSAVPRAPTTPKEKTFSRLVRTPKERSKNIPTVFPPAPVPPPPSSFTPRERPNPKKIPATYSQPRSKPTLPKTPYMSGSKSKTEPKKEKKEELTLLQEVYLRGTPKDKLDFIPIFKQLGVPLPKETSPKKVKSWTV